MKTTYVVSEEITFKRDEVGEIAINFSSPQLDYVVTEITAADAENLARGQKVACETDPKEDGPVIMQMGLNELVFTYPATNFCPEEKEIWRRQNLRALFCDFLDASDDPSKDY